MSQQQSLQQILGFMSYPAFAVKDGLICESNNLASGLFLLPGTDIFELLQTGHDEYQSFREGQLYLTLQVGNTTREATVVCVEGTHLFLLSDISTASQLETLALAAQQLRVPISDIAVITEQLFPDKALQANPTARSQMAQISRSLHQLFRLVGNMSDAARYAQEPQSNMMTVDATSLFAEVMEKAAALLAKTNVTLTYDGPSVPIYLRADAERIERSIYNLISNAVKFSGKCCDIHASLIQKKNLLLFTLCDSSELLAKELKGNVFNRYARQPGLSDSRFGLGLGLNIVQNTATSHGGTVLLECPPSGGTRITMTLNIRQSATTVVRNPFYLDYAGGHDHALLELSDVLPTSIYEPEL